MIHTLAPRLHVLDHASSVFGLALNGRCTVIELDDGLWVHSPVPLTPERRAAVDALGPVRYLVAPNLMHHLHLGAWMQAFPKAEVWAAPGLAAKRADLALPRTLGEGAPPWGGAIDPLLLSGTVPRLAESVFLHRESRTLIVTDMVFDFVTSDSWLTRLYLRATGAYGRMATTPVTRSVITDKPRLRAELDQVLAWDFDRVVPCHGQVRDTGGREALRAAYAWL